MQSQSSRDRLIVEVLANTNKIDSRSIPFDTVQKFTIDVSTMNSVFIRARLDDSVEGCADHGSVTAVLTDVVLK